MHPVVVSQPKLRDVGARLEGFLQGGETLTGESLYELLEEATALSRLRGIYRRGERNRTADGCQQSYANHNRLLLAGLDRLMTGDLEWYRGRVAPNEAIPDADLRRCFTAVQEAGLDAAGRLAVWIGAALHDCGMLMRDLPGVDVEDGAVLAAAVVHETCPPAVRALAMFAVRHHDYIKDVFTGEVPAAMVAADLADLPPGQRPMALTVLGMIQVAGAASLGPGRLTPFRMMIFDRCRDGTALLDGTSAVRVTRLFERFTGSPAAHSPAVESLLAGVPIHGWHRMWSAEPTGIACSRGIDALERLAAAWAPTGAEHIVIGDTLQPDMPGPPTVRTEELANGSVVAVLG